jgi:hypothetical protein
MAADEAASTADNCFFSFELHPGEDSFSKSDNLKLMNNLRLLGNRASATLSSFSKYRWSGGGFPSDPFGGYEDIHAYSTQACLQELP